MKRSKIYISGKMSADTTEAFQQNVGYFRDADILLRARGLSPVNPANVLVCRFPSLFRILGRILGEEAAYRMVLLYDLWLLSRCDGICLIDNWHDSRGAKVEENFAFRLGIKKMFHFDTSVMALSKHEEKNSNNKHK